MDKKLNKTCMLYKMPDEILNKFPNGYFQKELGLWYTALILGIIVAIVFLLKVRKVELKIQKRYFLSISFVLLFISFSRIFYIMGTNYEKFDYDLYILIGYTMAMIGLSLFILSLESIIIKKSKHLITIVSSIGVILSILGIFEIIDRDIIRVTNVYLSMLGLFTILVIHIIMIRKGIGDIRKKAILLTIGLVLFIIGFLGDSQLVYEMVPNISIYIFPILQIIGTSIMAFMGPLYVDAIFSLVHKGFRYF